jgi:hypothetical protein
VSSFYERLSNELLAEFHYWVSFNIQRKIRLADMYYELALIEKEMVKRSLTVEELYVYRIMDQ